MTLMVLALQPCRREAASLCLLVPFMPGDNMKMFHLIASATGAARGGISSGAGGTAGSTTAQLGPALDLAPLGQHGFMAWRAMLQSGLPVARFEASDQLQQAQYQLRQGKASERWPRGCTLRYEQFSKGALAFFCVRQTFVLVQSCWKHPALRICNELRCPGAGFS